MDTLRDWRSNAVLALVLVLSLATIATINVLQHRSQASGEARAKLTAIHDTLNRLQGDPFRAMSVYGGTPALARALTKSDTQSLTDQLDQLRRHNPPAVLNRLRAALRANVATLDQLLPLTLSPTFPATIDKRFFPLLKAAGATTAAAEGLLVQANREYHARATQQRTQATRGSALAIMLLFFAFALVSRRSHRARTRAEELAAENARLALSNADEARTDALTGLRNRRALADDFESELAAGGTRQVVVALFDLDGFKHYNDTFGHPAGDGLLARLGERLQSAVAGAGTAYRMGGDEFCVLAPDEGEGTVSIVQAAADALSEIGDAFEIGCSYGTALMPSEATSSEEALRLADQRLYEHKAGRSSASRQSTDVLLKVLSERNADLAEHLTGVSALASRTAERLGLSDHEIKRIGLAAELHDIGKTAIPDAILQKPGPLDAKEWEFMRQHTVIGERIIHAAPSLAPTAELVRSSHESFDGTGYPDGLAGDAIPLGARIITVCDAFDAMTSTRAYRGAMPTEDAIAELRRCAGTQFDPDVIDVFCALIEHPDVPPVLTRSAAIPA